MGIDQEQDERTDVSGPRGKPEAGSLRLRPDIELIERWKLGYNILRWRPKVSRSKNKMEAGRQQTPRQWCPLLDVSR
jgi:hypothetical protein